MSQASPLPIPSSQRPLPLVARSDLRIETVEYQDEAYAVVKDPIGLEYFRLQPEQQAVLELLDGRRSIEQIRVALAERFPSVRPTLAHIHRLVLDLYEKGLVWSAREGQGEALARRATTRRGKALLAAARNILFIKLPGWDPSSLLRTIDPLTRWIFHPLAIAAVAGLLLLAWSIALVRFDEVGQRLPELSAFFSWRNMIVLWVTLGFAKMLHELAHGLACRRFGGECHEIGLALLIFSPCLYCDVSDSWLLPNKWSRMAIAAAGIYVELAISSVAMLLWWNAEPGWTRQFLLNVFLVTNISAVVFNLNPLLRLDGYYLLSDWLEIPNLRRKSEQILAGAMGRCCLGVEPPADPLLPSQGRMWFLLYALAAAAYRWLLVAIVALILYKALEPYRLQNVGLLIGALAMISAVSMSLCRLAKFVQRHGEQMQSSIRPKVTAACATGLLALVLFVPFPIRTEAPFVVEPAGVRRVFAAASGQLRAIHVQPGQTVQQGQLLVELVDWQAADQLLRLKATRDVERIEAKIHRANGDATAMALSEENAAAIQKEIDALQAKVDSLKIVAPCDGRVIAAPKKHPALPNEDSLATWSGSPLEAKNLGCQLDLGDHVLSIAPDSSREAIMLLDPLNRNDVVAGQHARLKLDHDPHATYSSRIAKVATKAVAASNSTPESQGQHSPLPPHATSTCQATIPLPEGCGPVTPGSQGTARILLVKRSAAALLYRHARSTFSFGL